MPVLKIDAAFCAIAQCEPGKKKTDYYSNTQTGFGLECRPSGKKTYFQRYMVDGKLKQKAIAAYGEITFDQARKAGQRLRSEAVLGGDPSAKQAKRIAIPLYRELAHQHLTHAASYQRSYDSTRRIIHNHVLPRWGKLRLDEIKQQDVTAWLMAKRQSGLAPATVEKIRIMFSRSFELARQWQLFDGNPVKYVPRVKFNNARERYLTSDEANALKLACECSANPQLKHIVGLLLLTGARKSELLKAKWSEIDIDKRTWTLNMTKNGRGRHVPLSQAAMDIIGQLPRYPDCPWLLPNPQTLLPFTDIKRSFMEARKLAGLDDVHIHDLRHSYASALVNAGINLYQIGSLLGHQNVASTQRYAHVDSSTLMAAAEAGAAKLNVNW
ncbi:MAG: tyrosine-type recombinase/integrase [Sphingorhabdus sp.]|uniref:site-specific integrase n=1 Tax=Sphingorhabdus sp. TaxID=1902408 RepID=UPI0025EB1CCA|nr:site-specific integrase [Sphingorhabdus sp.]MCO4092872.1 tyrosine-type recombinase/integrase [Sphingorhabdus sp.]